jgi:coatomer subunit beta
LTNISHQKAVEYLMQNFDQITSMDAVMQNAVIELIQKDAFLNPANKAKYLRLIFDLLESPSNTVVYEAAISLSSLTSNPAAIKGTSIIIWV